MRKAFCYSLVCTLRLLQLTGMAVLYTRGRAMEVESRIARRRNQEEAMRRRWENHWNYLQKRDVQSTKRAAWFAGPTSPRPGSARGSVESRRLEEEAEEKRRRLEERRGMLRRLLDEERLGYEVLLYNTYSDLNHGASLRYIIQ